MILVDRGNPDEGDARGLAALEADALTAMRLIVAQHGRDPTGDELARFDYKVAGDLLWRRQGRKCAYCEHPEQRRRNDVEHFRPKGRANRGLFHAAMHGYWWLAWRWDNLLFACRNCNQTLGDGRGKRDAFPLAAESGVLVAEQDPYGQHRDLESPLLLDPSRESGVDHIEFRRVTLGAHHAWRPFARAGSERGDLSIWLLGLDRDDLVEAYSEHVASEVKPRADDFVALHADTPADLRRARWLAIERDLFRRGRPFVGLSYDALRCLVPDGDLRRWGITRVVPR